MMILATVHRLRGAAAVMALLALAFAVRGSLLARQQEPPAGTAIISGQVIDASLDAPVGGAIVGLQMVAADGPIRYSHPPVLTGNEGRFVFTGVPAGEYQIFAQRPGWSGGVPGRVRPPVAGDTFSPGSSIRVPPSGRVTVTIPMWRTPIVSGRVTDPRGRPLAGVRVGALRWAALAGRRHLAGDPDAITDDRGLFTLHAPPGEVVIVAMPPGGGVQHVGDDPASNRPIVVRRTFHPDAPTPAAATWLSLAYGEERGGIDIRMPAWPAVRVSGVVRNRIGASQMPSRLELVREEDDSPVRHETEVDGQGRFAFDHVPAGPYVIQTPAPYYPARPLSIDPEPWVRARLEVGDRDVEATVELHPPLVVRGRVELDGGPLPPAVGVTMSRIDVPDRSSDVTLEHVLPVDHTGSFAVAVPPGRYLVTARVRFGTDVREPLPERQTWWLRSSMLSGHDAADVPVSIGSDVPDLVLTFTNRRTVLRGRVTADEGRAGSTHVVVFPADDSLWTDLTPRRLEIARPGRDGTFEVVRLPAGTYLMAAVRDASEWSLRNPMMLRELARHARSATLREGQIHSGTLRAIEAPAVGAAQLPAPARVDVADRAEVRELPARPAPAGTTIAGRVVAAGSDGPVPFAWVGLTPGSGGTYADDEGRFELRGVPAGRQTLYASGAGYVTIAHGARRAGDPGVPIEVRDGEPVTGVTIEMVRAAAIAGTVRDHIGLPQSDALVSVHIYRSQAHGRVLVPASRPVLTDIHGRYRVYGLAPGDYVIEVRALGRAEDRVTLTTEADVETADGAASLSSTRTEVAYAPLFYPDTTDPSAAEAVPLAAGDERWIDFQLRLVPLRPRSGVVQ